MCLPESLSNDASDLLLHGHVVHGGEVLSHHVPAPLVSAHVLDQVEGVLGHLDGVLQVPEHCFITHVQKDIQTTNY